MVCKLLPTETLLGLVTKRLPRVSLPGKTRAAGGVELPTVTVGAAVKVLPAPLRVSVPSLTTSEPMAATPMIELLPDEVTAPPPRLALTVPPLSA